MSCQSSITSILLRIGARHTRTGRNIPFYVVGGQHKVSVRLLSARGLTKENAKRTDTTGKEPHVVGSGVDGVATSGWALESSCDSYRMMLLSQRDGWGSLQH